MDTDTKQGHFTQATSSASRSSCVLGGLGNKKGMKLGDRGEKKKKRKKKSRHGVVNFPDICEKCNLSITLMMSAPLLRPAGGFGPKHLRHCQGKPLQMEECGAGKKGDAVATKKGSQIWIVGSAHRLQLEPIIGVILIQLNQSELGEGRQSGGR